VTVPRSGLSKPASRCSKVDLPQPDGPTIATNSPSPTSKLTLSMTSSGPWSVSKLLPRSRTAILVDIAPPNDLEPLEPAHDPVERQSDQADDGHAGDHEVVAIAGIARIDNQ